VRHDDQARRAGERLGDQAGLAHPGLAGHQHGRRGSGHRRAQHGQLRGPADERLGGGGVQGESGQGKHCARM
jgi:hypothetical protein